MTDDPAIGEGLVQAASYDRSVDASLERVWENVFDWEHLPWLHARSFSSIELIEQGDWGWRVDVGNYDRPASRVELIADRTAGRYVARTTGGYGAGNEVWTTLSAVSDQVTSVAVAFHVPESLHAALDVIGPAYVALYRELWDEDEEMMQARDERLIAPASAADEPDMRLGGWSDLRSRLPLDVEFGGQPFQLAEIDGRPVVYSTVCPHQLGPLSAVDGDAGHLECPWHGYAFDALTGRSCDEHGLRLAVPPQVFVEPDTHQVWLRAPSAD